MHGCIYIQTLTKNLYKVDTQRAVIRPTFFVDQMKISPVTTLCNADIV